MNSASYKEKFLTNNIIVISTKIATKILNFILIIFLARYLSKEAYGDLTILLAYANIFIVFEDLGLNLVIVRETAMARDKAHDLLTGALVFKSLWGVVIICVLSGILLFSPYSEDIHNLSVLIAVGVVMQSFLTTLIKHFEGLEKMSTSSILFFGERLLRIGGVLASFYFYNLLSGFVYSYIIAPSALILIFMPYILKNVNNFINRIIEIIKYLLKKTIPFLFLSISASIFNRLDLIIISIFLVNSKVATFRAASQIIESIYFIPLSLSVTILPFFTKLISNKSTDLINVYNGLFRIALYAGLVFMVIVNCFNKEIIELLYPKYSEASILLMVLSFSVPLYFINIVNGNYLIGCQKEKINAFNMVIISTIKLVIIFAIITRFELLGIAIAVIVSEFISFLIQLYFVWRENVKYYLKFVDYTIISTSICLIFGSIFLFDFVVKIAIISIYVIIIGVVIYQYVRKKFITL